MPDDLDLEYTPTLESVNAPDRRHEELLAAARMTYSTFTAETPNPGAMVGAIKKLGEALEAYGDKEQPS